MNQTDILGRMAAAEHLALTALNIFVHFRASAMGADPVDEATTVARGLLATFVDADVPDDVRAAAMAALRADGDALIDAARRWKELSPGL